MSTPPLQSDVAPTGGRGPTSTAPAKPTTPATLGGDWFNAAFNKKR